MRALALALAVACGAPAPKRAASGAVLERVGVALGAPLADVRRARPALEPTGWREAERETWLDATFEKGLEIELEAGVVRAVAVTWADDRAEAEERRLRRALGASVECAASDQVADFRPTLWRTTDGAAVTLVRKKRILVVRVERPPPEAFERAWSTCVR